MASPESDLDPPRGSKFAGLQPMRRVRSPLRFPLLFFLCGGASVRAAPRLPDTRSYLFDPGALQGSISIDF